MRSIVTLTLVVVLSSVLFGGCEYAAKRQADSVAEPARSGLDQEQTRTESEQAKAPAARANFSLNSADKKGVDQATMQKVSLQQADQNQSIAAAVDRKIIKDGEFTLEVASPSDSQ